MSHPMTAALSRIPHDLPLIAVVGPTASGKSDWGIDIARAIGGEIISADSRQIYAGLDIGSGKVEGHLDTARGRTTAMLGERFVIAPFTSNGIDHWMIDISPPHIVVTMAQYQALALEAVADVAARGRVPIIVGGTGLYVSALLDGLVVPAVPPDPVLRAQLEGLSVEALASALLALDPDAASTVDMRNPRRLMRAIEVVRVTGTAASLRARVTLPWRATVLGPRLEREDLRGRIHARLMARLEQGMVAEVEGLLAQGVTHARLEDLGLEYRWVSRHLRGELSREQMTTALEQAIVLFAKRQTTWFRNHGTVTWLDTAKEAVARATAAVETPQRSRRGEADAPSPGGL